jgi:tetratricopeptide (TPR) repeat protein
VATRPENTNAEVLAHARLHRAAGRYAEMLAMLAGCEDWPEPHNEAATALRVGVLARRAPVAALKLLARTQDVFQSAQGRFAYYLASASAYTGTRNFDAAESMLELAQGFESAVDPAERSLLRYQRALLRWCKRAFDPGDPDVEALIGGSDPNGKFLGYELRGWMQAGLGRYPEQAADLIAAMQVAAAHPGTCDPELMARQVHALLRLGLELGDEATIEAGAIAYDNQPWSDDLRTDRYLCVRALAWSAFFRGDSAQAQWLFKDSKDFAASDAWKVMAHVDRAYVARMNGNEAWAVEELHAARTIARGVNWSATHGEERQALVMLATLFAPTDMARAQQYVSEYLQIGKDSVDPTLALAHDRRATAFEKYALGRVHQVLGNRELAISSFETAYEIFAAAGYRFRESLAATGLYEATGQERWLERARRAAGVYPNSAFHQRLHDRPGPIDASPLSDLTPMQRQLAFALCEGLDVAQLSRRFSRSAFTIAQMTNAVHERLGTRNRNDLRKLLRGWMAA